MQQQGVVKSFNPTKGYGFIELQGSADVFFMKSENKDFAAAGDSVAFQLATGERGPCAKEVQVVQRADGASFGVVKTYNAMKGFGFIECEQTQQVYGKDVFLMKSSLGGQELSVGTKVTFVVQESERGPQATNVKVVGGQMPQAGGMPAAAPAIANPAALGALANVPGVNQLLGALVAALSGAQQPAGKGQGKGMMQQQSFAPTPMGLGGRPSMSAGMQAMQRGGAMGSMGGYGGGAGGGGGGDGKISFGTVKSFNTAKGWGFIQTNSGEDVFVLSKSVTTGSVNPGDLVVFTKSMGPKGWQADTVSGVAAHELARSYIGSVKTWNAEKGWGFIAAPEAAKFGDVFLHNRDLSGQQVSQGDTVEFTIEMNNNGRPQARNVVSGGGGYGMGMAAGGGKGGRAVPY